MKKVLFFAIFSVFWMSAFAVDFEFKGNTAVSASAGYGNDSLYTGNLDNSADMTLAQNVKMTVKPAENIFAKTDITAAALGGTYTNPQMQIDLTELYIAWETEKAGSYYFGRKTHDFVLAELFPFADVMGKNNASLEFFVTNNKFLDFNGGLYYAFNNNNSLSNLNVFMDTGFFGDIFSFDTYTYILHCFDFPKDTGKNLFSDSVKLQKNIEDFQKTLEFITVLTGHVQLADFKIYGEMLVRTNPDKYKVLTSDTPTKTLTLAKVDKNAFFNGTLGVSYDNSVVKVSTEYCYAMMGYDHKEIEEINKYLIERKDDLNKIRNGQTAFFKNNIGISFTYNINDNWAVFANDKVTFPQYGASPDYIGTKFSVGGKFSYNDFLEFTASIEGAAGGCKNEFNLYDRNVASVKLSGKVLY